MVCSTNAIYAFDVEVARGASLRWKEDRRERNQKMKAVARGDIEGAESKERIAKRINYLVSKVKTLQRYQEAPLRAHVETLFQTGPVDANSANPALLERVLGETRDFLSIEFLSGGLDASRSVARIVTKLGGGRVSYGTGFLVGPGLLLTNHHVLMSSEHAELSIAEFDYQLSDDGQPLTVQRYRLAPRRLFFNDRDFDMALVAVDDKSMSNKSLSDYGFCPLIATEGKILIGDPINIIQHPLGQMKQVVMRENRLLDLPKTSDGRYAHYEADTEPGSSGSPVFNDQWEVVALHHSSVPRTDSRGRPLNKDGGVWQQGEQMDFVGNEGIRVSRLISLIKSASLTGEARELRDLMLEAGGKPKPRSQPQESTRNDPDQIGGSNQPITTASVQPTPISDSNSTSITSEVGVMRFTVPLTITVSLGRDGATILAEDIDSDSSDEGLETKKAKDRPAPNYATRPGYDPNFLGAPAPLPKPVGSAADNVLQINGGGSELKYFHYSVIMNARRRLAFVSAVNIDADAPVRYEREGKDKWYFDPRLDEEEQADNRFYKDNPLDRGHLTRRADAAWGRTEVEAQLANIDTFHWTNCAPQHEVFNQSTKADQRGLLLWGNLENHVQSQAERGLKQVSVLNGPVFRNDDRNHRGLQIPREYWKVIIYRKDATLDNVRRGQVRLAAAAFILSQASLIKSLPEEDFIIGPYKPFQVKITELGRKTKLNFGVIEGMDAMARPGIQENFEEGAEVIPIDSLEKMIL